MSDIVSTLTQQLAAHYRVERELGVGGMATVYLAHDLKHDRDVAIKVLHPDLGAALGGERFLSEIRTTARLQHPHILPLLDSGEAGGLLYYVMPLVTGETLRARLERERLLPIHDAVTIAREVADALGYAHGLGVIHRDIKPENILLQNGHAMVADFGIALAVQSAGGARMTQTGLSLGTPQYMSPEQAMGERTIDARSDIYALGAVTYEMLAGEAPFTGPSVQAIVARLMSEEPRSLGKQRKAIPEQVEYAVMRALEKLPADRWATAREFADALDETTTSPIQRGAATRLTRGVQRRASWRTRLSDPLVMALAVLALIASLAAGWARRPVPVVEQLSVRFAIPASRNGSSTALGLSDLAISRDGRMMVYVGKSSSGRNGLLLRPIDDVQARALPGTEGGDSPFFSPDGRWVGFMRGNQIYKTSIEGGTPQLLATAPGTFNGASWSTTGVIVTSGNLALYAIPETGGTVRELSKAEKSKGEVFQDAPIVVDDAKVVLYASWPSSSPASAKIAIASLESGEVTVLNLVGLTPLGVIDGMLFYVTASGAIMAVPIDVARRRVEGTPVQVATDVSINATTGLARAALSATGTLFFASGTLESQAVLADMHGSATIVLGAPRAYAFPRYSPDGTQLAMTIGTSDQRDVWLYDVASGAASRLTTEGRTNERPEWTPDGKRVLYRTDRDGRSTIWWRPADLSAAAQPLLARQDQIFEAVLSPDGRNIAYQLDTTGADIYYSALQGDTTPKPIANSRAIESMPRISPDGRWIAFVTDESGTNQIVMQPFPGPGPRIQLSAAGGSEPVWSRDGSRVFYRGDGVIMAARVRTSPTLGVLGRDSLFADDFVHSTNPHANFDVSPDGSHLLMLKPISEEQMIVVSNWSSGLKTRIAQKRGM
ncbi:MAG: protein kinase [bacterium]